MFDQIDSISEKTTLNDRLRYNGSGTELALLMFKNLALTILTLGIYAAWGRTNTRRYIWGKVEFLGDRAAYTGTGKELFRGWMIVVGFYLLAGLILKVIAQVNALLPILFLPLYIYVYAIAIYGGARYRMSRTTWRETTFTMQRDKVSTQLFIWMVVKGTLLTGLTLGIYAPIFQNDVRRFLVNKGGFGTINFNYDSENMEFFKLFFWNLFLTIITLGFYGSWMLINIMKYKLKCSNLNNTVHFDLKLKGLDIFLFSVLSYICTLLTFGLALPWILNRGYGLFFNAIEVTGEIDFTKINNVVTEESAIGDVAAIEYDLDLGF